MDAPSFNAGDLVRDVFGYQHRVRHQVGCAVYVVGSRSWFHPTKLTLVASANQLQQQAGEIDSQPSESRPPTVGEALGGTFLAVLFALVIPYLSLFVP